MSRRAPALTPTSRATLHRTTATSTSATPTARRWQTVRRCASTASSSTTATRSSTTSCRSRTRAASPGSTTSPATPASVQAPPRLRSPPDLCRRTATARNSRPTSCCRADTRDWTASKRPAPSTSTPALRPRRRRRSRPSSPVLRKNGDATSTARSPATG